MRQEDDLLLLLCRAELSVQELRRLQDALALRLDWDYFFTKARQEGVDGFVYRHLKGRTLVPEAARHLAALKDQRRFETALNAGIFEQVRQLSEAFKNRGVDFIPLKGLFLLEEVYQDISLRPLSDADILIKREDLRLVHEILVSLGYEPPRYLADQLDFKGVTSLNSAVYFKQAPVKFDLHLHWHLINSSWPLETLAAKIDMSRVWERAVGYQVNGIEGRAMSAEHLVIYSCHHAFLHYLSRWIRLAEISAMIKHYDSSLDWGFIAAESERFGLALSVYVCLERCRRLFGMEMAGLSEFKFRNPGEVLRAVDLFGRPENGGYYIRTYWFYLAQEQEFKAWLKFIKETVLPSPLIIAHNLNIPQNEVSFRHYLKRVLR